MRHNRLGVIILSTLVLTLAGADVPTLRAASGKVTVTNSNDSGPGSFRDAITQANSDPTIVHIQFKPSVGTVALLSTVWFSGTQDLTIKGNATLDGTNAGGPAFRATGGGDLSVFNLTVQNAPAEGISVELPTSSTGTVRVWLANVTIADNDGHGVLVNDQDDPNTAPVEGDSEASVDVTVENTVFSRNGFSVSDRDGLRVNEGGLGDLIITVLKSQAKDNAADGIEVDEKGEGDVRVYMFGTQITGNGSFDPADLDDGFDIDEFDEGSVLGTIFNTVANDNYEEGLDFNENHAGDLRVDLIQVEASGNREEGIDYEEDDDFAGGGDLVSLMFRVVANGNTVTDGDAGLKIREKGDGNLDVTLNTVETLNNADDGVQIREDADGDLVASIANASSSGNGGNGINFDENRDGAGDPTGDLTATVTKSKSSGNTGAGVRADQQTPPGTGSLRLEKVKLAGNTGGTTSGSNVVVTIIP